MQDLTRALQGERVAGLQWTSKTVLYRTHARYADIRLRIKCVGVNETCRFRHFVINWSQTLRMSLVLKASKLHFNSKRLEREITCPSPHLFLSALTETSLRRRSNEWKSPSRYLTYIEQTPFRCGQLQPLSFLSSSLHFLPPLSARCLQISFSRFPILTLTAVFGHSR